MHQVTRMAGKRSEPLTPPGRVAPGPHLRKPLIMALLGILAAVGPVAGQDAAQSPAAGDAPVEAAVPESGGTPIPLDRPGVVNMALKDAPALTVFEQIVLNGSYDLVTRGSIDATVTAFLSGVSIQDALDTITQTIGVEYRVLGRIVTLYGEGSEQAASFTETYKFNIAAVGAIGGPGRIIKRLVEGGADEDELAAEGQAAGGTGAGASTAATGESKGTVIIDKLNNQLVVTTVPSLHRRISKLVSELDRPAEDRAGRQSRIFELRYVTPELFKAAILFQFPGFQEGQMLLFSQAGVAAGGAAAAAPAAGAAGGVSTGELEANLKRVIVSDTVDNLDRIENLLKAIDKPSRQVFVDVKLMEVDNNTQDDFGAQVRAIYMKNGRNQPLAEFLGDNPSNAGNPFKLKFGTLGPEQVQVLFDYLEQRNKANLLSNPKMTVIDGRQAEIRLVTREPYGETTVNQGVTQTQVQFVDVGITLRYTPTIYRDNYIKLALAPEVSDAPARVNINNNEVPRVTQTSANTTLYVKNNHTVIIGGIIRADKVKNFTTVPLLGHIPILGRVFHNHDERDNRTELMITITPKIVEHDDFNWTSHSKGWAEGKYKYLFHDAEQVLDRILFIDEVVQF